MKPLEHILASFHVQVVLLKQATYVTAQQLQLIFMWLHTNLKSSPYLKLLSYIVILPTVCQWGKPFTVRDGK
jgi:hypothetical protein